MTVTIAGISPYAVTANNFGGSSPYQYISINADVTVDIDLEWAQPFASIGTGQRRRPEQPRLLPAQQPGPGRC